MGTLGVNGCPVLRGQEATGGNRAEGGVIDRGHERIGRNQSGGGERSRDALGRQRRDERLTDPERCDRPLDVVELGHREGPCGLAEGVGVVGRERAERVLDAIAELRQDRGRDVGWGLRHEVHADALRSNQAGGPLDLLHEGIGCVVEEQVCLVEEEAQLGLREVADLGQDLVQLGQHPEHERREQARLGHDVAELEERHDAPAIGCRPQQVPDVELRLAEEDVGAGLLEDDDRTKQHADARCGHPAVIGQDRLALVRRQVLERRHEVVEVEQGEVVVVAVLEDQGEDRGLGRIEVKDLAEQDRPERMH